MFQGFPLIKSAQGVCQGCVVGKPEKMYEVGKERRETSILDLIHSDVLGPIPIEYMNGSKYFLTLIDDYFM